MKLITTKSLSNDNCHFVTTYRISRIIPSDLSVSFLKSFVSEKLSWEHLNSFVQDSIDSKLRATNILSVRHILEIYYFDCTNKNFKTTNYVIRFPITFVNSKLVPTVAEAIHADRKVLCDLADLIELEKNVKLQFDLFLKIYETLFDLEDFKLDRIKLYHSFVFSEKKLSKGVPSLSELTALESESDSE